MKLKFLFIALIISSYSIVSADIIHTMPVQKRSAIQSTNMPSQKLSFGFSDNTTYSDAIQELENKLKSDPENYSVYVSLVNLYIKTKQFDKSYNHLFYLAKLKKENLLSPQVISSVSELGDNLKNLLKYNSGAYLLADEALINVIISKPSDAEKYINKAISTQGNISHIIPAFKYIYDYTKNFEGAVESIDIALTRNHQTAYDLKKIKAVYLLKLNKSDEALKDLTEIIKIKPDDEDTKYLIYKLLASKNASEKELLNTIYKNQSEETAFQNMASILINNGEYDSALDFAQRLVKKYPDNVNGYIFLSEIYRNQGKFNESYKALEKIKDKADDKESIAKYNVLTAQLSDEPIKEASSLMNNGLYSQALEVLNSSPDDNLYVMLNKAVCYYYLDGKQKSLELLNRAMSFYPNNSEVMYYFALVFFNEKNLDTSREYINKALKLNQSDKKYLALLDKINQADADKYISQITSYIDSQNYKEAMRLIDEAISINKKDSKLYLYKGIVYIAQNNYAASTAVLYKAIELDKNNTLAYYYLGAAFDNLSEYSNALDNYKKFISRLPKDDYGESELLQYAKDRVNKLSIQNK